MPEAFIIDAVRTAVGRKKGGFATMHPADLGAAPIVELMRRTRVDPAATTWCSAASRPSAPRPATSPAPAG
jgi:acetyl-CoA acetyltransferase